MALLFVFASFALVAGTSHHALTRSIIASPRAVVIAKAAAPTQAARAAQSAADKLRAAMAQELTARKQAAQSAADKLHAGTFAGPADVKTTVTTTAQIDQLLVETRRAREATEKLLTATEKAARVATLRWAIENVDMHEFPFKYNELPSSTDWCRVDSESGWVVAQVLCSFQLGRKHLLNDLFDDDSMYPGNCGYIGEERSNKSVAAFVDKLVEQIDKLIGEKPLVHKKKIIYSNAKEGDTPDFEYTLRLRYMI